MKILFCTSSMGKGGAERVISILSNRFINNNDVYILVNTNKNIEYELDKRIKVVQLDEKVNINPITRNIERIIKTKKKLKEIKPDIIISFLPMPSFRVIIANSKLKIPVIVSDRNDPNEEYKSKISKIFMKCLYPKANGFVFQTKQQKEYFSNEIQNKSIIIFNPIKNEFVGVDTKDIKKIENTIINVGRLVEQKNQKMLINAFSKVSKKHKKYNLKIYGEGPLKEEIEKQIELLNLKDRVMLMGLTDNIKDELANSKIFILSSNYEGMPNALIEAMSMGCGVISTDCPCGGPKELIDDGKNGILIQTGNEEELEKSINLLIENEEMLTEIGKNAQKVSSILEEKNIVKQWENYIKYILKKSKEVRYNNEK